MLLCKEKGSKIFTSLYSVGSFCVVLHHFGYGLDVNMKKNGVSDVIQTDKGVIETPIGPLLTVREVARILRLEATTVRGMAKRQEIPAIKVGKVWRFKRSEIEKWLSHDNFR